MCTVAIHIRRVLVGELVQSAALRKTHDLFWEPVAQLLPEGTETIGLSPDGALNFLSFAVLMDGGNQFLAQKYRQVVYFTSARDLLAPPNRTALTEGPWALVAVPDFEPKGATPVSTAPTITMTALLGA